MGEIDKSDVDAVHRIPPTQAQGRNLPRRAGDDQPGADHIVVPYSNITSGGAFFRFRVACDWLRIVADWPVSVFADGVRVSPILPLRGEEQSVFGTYEAQELNWQPAGYRAPQFGIDFVLRRRVRVLQLFFPDVLDDADQSKRQHPGAIHLWIGRNGVENVGPGPWWYSSWTDVVAAPGGNPTLATFGPINFETHQSLGIISGTDSGQHYQLPEVEMLSLYAQMSSACALDTARVYWEDSLGTQFDLWVGNLYEFSSANVYHAELDHVRVPNWDLIQNSSSLPPKAEGVYVDLLFSVLCQLEDVVLHVNFRGR